MKWIFVFTFKKIVSICHFKFLFQTMKTLTHVCCLVTFQKIPPIDLNLWEVKTIFQLNNSIATQQHSKNNNNNTTQQRHQQQHNIELLVSWSGKLRLRISSHGYGKQKVWLWIRLEQKSERKDQRNEGHRSEHRLEKRKRTENQRFE